ncbi:MAG: response regulator [Chthoniobacteraceae bacterium]|jgi:DNA-binding response OmpR family regulator
MKTLIVDDDAITRVHLNSTLTKLGHDVHEAADGHKALDAWHGGEFPFVILDWMMPGLDGLEFCRRIRAGQREDYTYIVLLTSNAGRANRLEAIDAGVDDFITKPLNRDVLLARTRVAERIHGLHTSLRATNTGSDRHACKRLAELQRAIHASEDFFSHASHELHSSMNNILGFAQLLQLDELTGDQTSSVRQILMSGHRLLHMIDRILSASQTSPDDLSCLDSGRTNESLFLPS